jgi:FkbM family methyltransferase
MTQGTLNIVNSPADILETVDFALAFPGKPPKHICGHKGDVMLQILKWPDPWRYAFLNDIYRRAARGGSCVEVGANIGSAAVFLADFFQRVYAFEPSSRNRDILRRNLELNAIGNTQILPTALGDQPGTATLHVDPSNNSGQDSLIPLETQLLARTENVPVTTLDLALPDVTDVTFLHVDTEGYDVKVLNGAREFVRRQQARPCIQVKFAPHLIARSGATVDELLSFIAEFGYKVMYPANHNAAPLTPDLVRGLFDAWKNSPAWEEFFLLP